MIPIELIMHKIYLLQKVNQEDLLNLITNKKKKRENP
jgi:hypothetical protein